MDNYRETQEEAKKSEWKTKWATRIGIGLFLFGLIIGIAGAIAELSPGRNELAAFLGLFGDFIGGVVGAIWTLTGVALIYSTVEQQRQDIKINQTTLNEYRKELKIQRRELFSFRRVFEIEKFEKTFFQLIEYQKQAIKLIETGHSENESTEKISGLDCFKAFFKEMLKLKENNSNVSSGKDCYGIIYNKHKQSIQGYIQSVSQILSFVSKFEFTTIDYNKLGDDSVTDEVLDDFNQTFTDDGINRLKMEDYVSILKSQLTPYEYIVIFYHSLYHNDGFLDKLKELNILDDLKLTMKELKMFIFEEDETHFERNFE